MPGGGGGGGGGGDARLGIDRAINAGLVLTPGQNRYFLNKRWGRLIGFAVFI